MKVIIENQRQGSEINTTSTGCGVPYGYGCGMEYVCGSAHTFPCNPQVTPWNLPEQKE